MRGTLREAPRSPSPFPFALSTATTKPSHSISTLSSRVLKFPSRARGVHCSPSTTAGDQSRAEEEQPIAAATATPFAPQEKDASSCLAPHPPSHHPPRRRRIPVPLPLPSIAPTPKSNLPPSRLVLPLSARPYVTYPESCTAADFVSSLLLLLLLSFFSPSKQIHS